MSREGASQQVVRHGRETPAAIGIGLIEKARPRAKHWYLHGLGTRPERQGRGLGARVMQPVLTAADEAGIGCYLEASNPANVPYYRRFGFEVEAPIRLPGGPEVWTMWREPRPGVRAPDSAAG